MQKTGFVQRLHVGGLTPEVSEEDLRKRFSSFGEVISVNILCSKFDPPGYSTCRGFAFLDLKVSHESVVERCISVLNCCKWKGRIISVARARPDYLERIFE